MQMLRSPHEPMVQAGRITAEALAVAREKAAKSRVSVEQVLRTEHGLTAEELGASLAAHYRTDFVPYRDDLHPLRNLMKGLEIDQWKRHRCVPVGRDGRKIVVLMADPNDLPARDHVEAVLGEPLLVKVAFAEDIHLLITGQEPATDGVPDLLSENATRSLAVEAGAGESAVVVMANQILLQAWGAKAEEVRVHPREQPALAIRIGDTWRPLAVVPPTFLPALIRRFKVMAALDSMNSTKPQEGGLELRLSRGSLSVRVATQPLGDGLEVAFLRQIRQLS
jgi:type IV pilus assembly protein PilB